MGEADKASNEIRRSLGRDIDPVLRDGLQRRVGRRLGVPVELHIDAARPLDHGIAADGVGKRRHKNGAA